MKKVATAIVATFLDYDIEGYIEHKSTFIEKIYAEIGI